MNYLKHRHNKHWVGQAANIISAKFVIQIIKHAARFIGAPPTNQVLMPALKHHFLLKWINER